MIKPLATWFFCNMLALAAYSNVMLPSVFGDQMILQQNTDILIWGWAKPLEPVQITTDWSKDTLKTLGDSYCNWQLKLRTPKADNVPHTIRIQGYNSLQITNVLLGEVWLCSGQSNMEWSARMGIDNAEKAISDAQNPNIRFFTVRHRTADTPQLDVAGSGWVACTPESMVDFSALAYFFARDLNVKLNVPIGIVHSSWGGTPAEVWVNSNYLQNDTFLLKAAQKLQPMKWGPHEPGKAYRAMIEPLKKFKIAGTLWYQGESNVGTSYAYEKLLRTLVRNWRDDWGYDFPFVYAQIAPWKGYGPNELGAVLRNAQRKAMSMPNAGMVVTSDIGDLDNIHPGNKETVGARMANWALKLAYNQKIDVSGPLYKNMAIEKNKIRLYFDYAENGLLCKGKELTEFEIAGADGKYEPATATIDGSTLVVQSKNVPKPRSVRFGWSNSSQPNLFNQEGLPASCFRTKD
jgi:sialate O-acetylesterase